MIDGIRRSIPRFDGTAKAVGAATYISDVPHRHMLYARFYRSPIARGRLKQVMLPPLPDGYHVVDHRDVPGHNHISLIKTDWLAFAVDEIRYLGQIILLVAGPDPSIVDDLIESIRIDADPIPPAVSLDDGIGCVGGPIHGTDNIYADIKLEQGETDTAFSQAARVIEGEYCTGFQEQMYMEPQGLIAWYEADNSKIVIHGSLQCPFYVKHAVQEAMGDDVSVRVIQATTGGGFGGKEDYPEIMGVPLAVAAKKIGMPIRMIFDRGEDLAFTSKRHPSRTTVRTAHGDDGSIEGIEIDLYLNGGAYESYSLIVLQRALFTSLGAYRFKNARVRGRAVATNTVPSGAFRGFGAPQAIFAIEMHMERVARELGLLPLDLKSGYFLRQGDPTITGGVFREPVILDSLIEKAISASDYIAKRRRYNSIAYKGIGLSVFNHGCGFTGDGEQRIIRGKVRLKKHVDDTLEILAASIDMGQGPQTTFRKLVGEILDIPPETIIFDNPDTDRVPDSGPTVASRTMMVVGNLVYQAAMKLKACWVDREEQEVEVSYSMPPGMKWNQDELSGDAYAAFGWGVNIVEVEVDLVSYETTVLGAWGVYDVGVAIDELVVNGQIQGGMSQALGFGSLEKLEVDSEGRFLQRSMADYTVATSLDFPRTYATTIDNPYEHGPFGAKGMGEMVHNGGHAAFAAAVEQATGRSCPTVPITPERLMETIRDGN
jgi:CO/xanthine dehydrogenase Mo-binding subunit